MRLSMAFPRSCAIFALMTALLIAIPLAVLSDESHVWFSNQTPDGWAFVTESHTACQFIPLPAPHNQCKLRTDHSWCVAPGAGVQRSFPFHIDDVRVEVTMTSNCRQPIVFDKRLPFARSGATSTNVFKLFGHGGRYSFVGQRS